MKNYELRVIWWLRCVAYSKSPFGAMNYELRITSYWSMDRFADGTWAASLLEHGPLC